MELSPRGEFHIKKGFFIMHYFYGDWLEYDEVEKIKQYFDIKDVKYIGCNNEGIVIDFFYNNRIYDYQRLMNIFNGDKLLLTMDQRNATFGIGMQKSICIEIHDLETLIDISDKPYAEIFPVSEEILKDWRYINLMFDLIRMNIDDIDGCRYLESLSSYHDFKNDPKVKAIIDRDILHPCENYLNTQYGPVLAFRKDWAQDGVCIAYHLIKMNHMLMEMIKKYPEYKPEFVKVVEAARQLGLHEEQLIISEFTATIQDQPDKWEL